MCYATALRYGLPPWTIFFSCEVFLFSVFGIRYHEDLLFFRKKNVSMIMLKLMIRGKVRSSFCLCRKVAFTQ